MNRPDTTSTKPVPVETRGPSYIAKPNRRILIVDDDPEVLHLYQMILTPFSHLYSKNSPFLPTDSAIKNGEPPFEISTASQGEEGLQLAKEGLEQGRPFAVAFLDVRMPPGMDGLETARRLRQIDPQINIIIASAYSDYQPKDFRRAVHDRLFFVRKPFIPEEVEHIAYNTCVSWDHERQLQQESQNNFLYHSWLQELFSALPIPVTVIDVDSYEVLLNTGPMKQMHAGATCYQQLHHQDHPCDQSHGECPLQSVREHGEPVVVQHTHYDSDGKPQHYEIHGVPITNEQGEVQQMLEFALDITDHEEALSHSLEQKETLLRQQRELFNLFRSTAHTMKNSISYLGGMAERVSEKQSHPEEIHQLLNPERMEMIQGQISMIQTMVQLALQNARKSAVQEESLSIEEKIHEAITLFSFTSRGKGKRIHLQLDEQFHHCIRTTPIDGQTLLLNLLNNAADAVDEYLNALIERGTPEDFERLTKLQNEPLISIKATQLAKVVEIVITNRGEPIPSEVQSQIFEQGFSLKPEGNGVGLFDVVKILQRIGGNISTHNGEDEVSFVLTLPHFRCDAKATKTSNAPTP